MALFPRIGPTEGNTYITITGKSFIRQQKIFCKFISPIESKVIEGSHISKQALSCKSPPSTRKGEVKIQVSFNGQEFIGNKLSFFYYIRPTLSSMHPKYGPQLGGTILNLFGNNFSDLDRIMCNFGNDHTSIPLLINENFVRCPVPSMSICGNHHLRLSNGSSNYTLNNVDISKFYVFAYLSKIIISPSFGTIEGGTLVKISTEINNCPLPQSGMYMCKFGAFLSSAARWIDTKT